MVMVYYWPPGEAIGALLKYLMRMLLDNLFTTFYLIKVNRIGAISSFSVTVAPPVGGIVLNGAHLCNMAVLQHIYIWLESN